MGTVKDGCTMTGGRGAARRATLVAAFAFALALICALLTGAGQKAWAAGEDISWYVGHEADSSYVLADVPDLQGLATLVNGGATDFAGKTLTVGTPGTPATSAPTLFLTGEWTPIGTADHPFNGTFDGQGAKIMNLSITKGSNGLGLFGYAGASSSVSNVSVAGSITLSTSTDFISYVGGVVGYTKGKLAGDTSQVKIDIQSTTAATADNLIVVNCVGGIAGRCYGDIGSCKTLSSASISVLSTSKAPTEDVSWVNTYVGGIVGCQGADWDDFEACATPTTISSCTNFATVRVRASADGGKDRFGEQTYAHSRFLGGIAGYAFSNIENCANSGLIDSSEVKEETNATTGKTETVVQSGYGASATGGIVGGWRIDDETSPAGGTTDDAGTRYEKQHGTPVQIQLIGCSNTGKVLGLAQVGGVAGECGAYTLITQSYNTGAVEGTRWNKPCPAGIASRTYGDISYCYNQGDCTSTSGGGYYVAGIVGMLHSAGTDSHGDTITPEVYACYNTGYMLTDSASYRSGSIVGELDGGYIHNCFSLANRSLTGSVSGLKDYQGTIADTVKEIGENDATTQEALALLNGNADKDGWNVYFALPANTATYGKKNCYPVLATTSHANATDLSTISGAIVTTTANACYSASMDPVPSVSVTLSTGKTLVQNVDYRVVPQAGTAGANVGSTEYQATIEGIGIYKGVLGTTATYRIIKGDITSCTVVSDSKYFNFAAQKPDKVTVYDESGTAVPEDQYTWSVDESLYGQPNSTGTFTYYVDAQDQTAATGYPIIVTATDTSNYTGSLTAEVFKIKQVSFVKSNSSSNPNQDSFEIGNVIWGDQSWKFSDVCDYEVVAGGKSEGDKKGVMKVKYTGSPITPTVDYVRYMNHDLLEIKTGDAWYDNPKAYGYKLLYGNGNPENSAAQSSLEAVTNVTGTDYAVMTVRSAYYSNYDNYLTVWFEITPASIADDVTMDGFQKTVMGDPVQSEVTFTYNGITLVEGTDYTVAYTDLGSGEYQATYTGIGNYNGEVTKTFTVFSPTKLFNDVPQDAWYYQSVYRAVNANLCEGYPDGNFGPNNTLNRAEAAVMLWRHFAPEEIAVYDSVMAQTKNATGMADVADAQWYTGAANWAVANGVISGKDQPDGSKLFDPMGQITREQMCALVANAAIKYAGATVDGADRTKFNSMPDVSSVDGWAIDSVAWGLNKGVISGKESADGRLIAPLDIVTRAEAAAIFVNTIDRDLWTASNLAALSLEQPAVRVGQVSTDAPDTESSSSEVSAAAETTDIVESAEPAEAQTAGV